MSKKHQRHGTVYATTIGISAHSLLKGQLAWMHQHAGPVSLVTTPDDAAQRCAEREGVRLVGIPMERGIHPLRDVVSLFHWYTFLKRERPAALHVGTPKAGLLGTLAGWLTRVPKRIYIVRGLRLEGAKGPTKALLWLMERVTLALATDAIVVSDSLRAQLQRHRLADPTKVHLLGAGSSNGVDAKGIARRLADTDRQRLRASLGFSDRDFVVGFVGRVTPDKGVSTLTAAFGSPGLNPRARLLLIGPIEDTSLLAQIEGLGPKAHSVGWTDDVWGHLAALDLLALPSLREGFPTVVLEAAAAGVPAVTTRATGAVDSVIDGRTGLLFDVGDCAALAELISQLADDPEQLHFLGQNAKHRAISDFRQEAIWQQTLDLLNSPTGKTGRTTADFSSANTKERNK